MRTQRRAQLSEVEAAAPSDAARAVAADAIAAERRRILSSLLANVHLLVEAALTAVRSEIPAYTTRDARFLEDVRDQLARHYCVNLSALLAERELTLDDVAFVRSAAARRVRAGLELTDYLNAFRVSRRALWSAVVRCAGESDFGHDAAFELALLR